MENFNEFLQDALSLEGIISPLILYLVSLNLYWFIAVNIFKRRWPAYNNEQWEAIKETYNEGLRKEMRLVRLLVFGLFAVWHGLKYLFVLSGKLLGLIIYLGIAIIFWIYPYIPFGLFALFSGYWLLALILPALLQVLRPVLFKNIKLYRTRIFFFDLLVVLAGIFLLIKIVEHSTITFHALFSESTNIAENDWVTKAQALLALLLVVGVLWFLSTVGVKYYTQARFQELKRLFYKERYSVIRDYFKDEAERQLPFNPILDEGKVIYEKAVACAWAKEREGVSSNLMHEGRELEDYIYLIGFDEDDLTGEINRYISFMSSEYDDPYYMPRANLTKESLVEPGQILLSLHLEMVIRSPIRGEIEFFIEDHKTRYRDSYTNDKKPTWWLSVRPFKGHQLPLNYASLLFEEVTELLDWASDGKKHWKFLLKKLKGVPISESRVDTERLKSFKERLQQIAIKKTGIPNKYASFEDIRGILIADHYSTELTFEEFVYLIPVPKIHQYIEGAKDIDDKLFDRFFGSYNFRRRKKEGKTINKGDRLFLFPYKNEEVQVITAPVSGKLNCYYGLGGYACIQPFKNQQLPENKELLIYGDYVKKAKYILERVLHEEKIEFTLYQAITEELEELFLEKPLYKIYPESAGFRSS